MGAAALLIRAGEKRAIPLADLDIQMIVRRACLGITTAASLCLHLSPRMVCSWIAFRRDDEPRARAGQRRLLAAHAPAA